MSEHEKIDYVEFQVQDFEATKAFFSQVFGWSFTDYGSDYVAFHGAGLEGGFYLSDKNSTPAAGAMMIIFYSKDLESTQEKVEQACGNIVKPITAFPGGRRFQFADPNGNEFAVWSDKGLDHEGHEEA